jgi:Zn-dependent peptidase ImmA (M78 family)
MRSMSSATKRARDSADVRVDWLRELATYLCDVMPMPETDLPDLSTESDPTRISEDSIEDCSIRLRRAWGMRDGPIANLTDLLEAKGFVVSRFSLGAETLHAFSKWAPELPVIVKNTDVMTAVRMRFDLAHELGHMVMHRHVPDALAGRPEIHKLMETQAHRFAGAFVFPATSFVNEIYSVSIHGLLEPKRRWKLSVQTMTRRARDLRLISQDQYERAFRTISAKGFRKREPLDDTMEAEAPKHASQRVRHLIEERGFTVDEIEMQTRQGRREIEALCSLPLGYLDRSTDPAPTSRKIVPLLGRGKREINL